MSSPLSWRSKLFLIAFGVAIPLITLEIGLRFLKPTNSATEFESIDELRSEIAREGHTTDSEGNGVSLKSIIYPHEDDTIIYDLRPHLAVQFQRAHVETNSCGMRSPERPIVKERNVFRIALLGDSFAFGWGVKQQESFAQVLEDNLNRIYKGSPRIEVLNLGVPGYSTFQEVHLFLEKGAQFNPDAVVVFFVQNDFGPPFFIRNIGKAGIVPSTQIAQLATKLIDPKEAEHALTNAGLDPNRSLSLLADYTNKMAIPLYVAINPRKEWRNYYRGLWVLKKRPEIRFMRLREDFEHIYHNRKINPTDLNLSFDPHPSPLRHAIYGDIMTPYFMDLITPQ